MTPPNTTLLANDLTKIHFSMTKKRLPSRYISSIPQCFNLITVREFRKPKRRGEANGFIFYREPFYYVTAKFNLNTPKVDVAGFLFLIETMFSTLQYLNNRKTSDENVILILEHIKEYSNYVFDVSELCLLVSNFQYNPLLVTLRKRDYIVTEYTVYERY